MFEIRNFKNVIEVAYHELSNRQFFGKWHSDIFKNNNSVSIVIRQHRFSEKIKKVLGLLKPEPMSGGYKTRRRQHNKYRKKTKKKTKRKTKRKTKKKIRKISRKKIRKKTKKKTKNKIHY